jgi:hypothetical protein
MRRYHHIGFRPPNRSQLKRGQCGRSVLALRFNFSQNDGSIFEFFVFVEWIDNGRFRSAEWGRYLPRNPSG